MHKPGAGGTRTDRCEGFDQDSARLRSSVNDKMSLGAGSLRVYRGDT
jgi:hypothetical protein